MKTLRHMAEAAGLWLAFTIFRLLPSGTASSFGGWIGRTVGPRLGASRKAYKNLHIALPGKTQTEYDAIILAMWHNLGRVMAEYPHLQKIIDSVDIVGNHHLKDLPESFVVIGGHLANWELLPYFFNHRANLPTTSIYRAPNNPYTEELLDRCRNPGGSGSYVPKSKSGTRALVSTIKDGGRVAILIDQKYNEGIRADFFGHPAMTSASFATLARKYDCPILPVWVERIEGTKFRIVIEPPFTVDGRSDEELVAHAHALLEQQILKRPGHWLWLHRRWIKG